MHGRCSQAVGLEDGGTQSGLPKFLIVGLSDDESQANHALLLYHSRLASATESSRCSLNCLRAVHVHFLFKMAMSILRMIDSLVVVRSLAMIRAIDNRMAYIPSDASSPSEMCLRIYSISNGKRLSREVVEACE